MASKKKFFSFLPIDAKVGAGGFISNSSAVWSKAAGVDALQAITAGTIGFRAPDGGKLDVCVTGPRTKSNEFELDRWTTYCQFKFESPIHSCLNPWFKIWTGGR